MSGPEGVRWSEFGTFWVSPLLEQAEERELFAVHRVVRGPAGARGLDVPGEAEGQHSRPGERKQQRDSDEVQFCHNHSGGGTAQAP